MNESAAADAVVNSQLMIVDQLASQLLALLNVTRTSLIDTIYSQVSNTHDLTDWHAGCTVKRVQPGS